jgi:hypothetical protein
MHARFQQVADQRCGACCHLVAVVAERLRYRCRQAIVGAGENSVGWSPSWPACGQFVPATAVIRIEQPVPRSRRAAGRR